MLVYMPKMEMHACDEDCEDDDLDAGLYMDDLLVWMHSRNRMCALLEHAAVRILGIININVWVTIEAMA